MPKNHSKQALKSGPGPKAVGGDNEAKASRESHPSHPGYARRFGSSSDERHFIQLAERVIADVLKFLRSAAPPVDRTRMPYAPRDAEWASWNPLDETLGGSEDIDTQRKRLQHRAMITGTRMSACTDKAGPRKKANTRKGAYRWIEDPKAEFYEELMTGRREKLQRKIRRAAKKEDELARINDRTKFAGGPRSG